jgi:membrane-bound lytic murein transglycosylase D
MASKLLVNSRKRHFAERKRSMRNYLFVAIVLLLMACSNIVHFHKEAADYEPPRQPPTSVTKASLKPEEIPSKAPHETTGLPHGTVLSRSDTTREGREGQEQGLLVGIPDPTMDDESRAFSEPDLPPAEQGVWQSERETTWLQGFLGEHEDRFLEEQEVCFHDVGPFEEETGAEESAFDIPITINGKVEQWVKYYQTRGRKVFSRWLARSRKYIPLMKELLGEKGLPEDLVYLALIESGYNPRAYSRRKAMGLWQFRYHTGKRYGLRVNWWIDERRDPVKSTVAAARYLKDLYDRFECWYLAAAGYNAGEGKISRAIKRYKTEDFWELTKYPYLKRETKNFIPKMIAAAVIAKNPEDYGFSDISYEEPIRFETVRVNAATDLRVIAKASESTYKELKRLNPELRRWCTPPNFPDYELKLPYGKKEVFVRNFSKIRPSERITFRRHVVRSDETLSHIALKYRTDIGAITRMNSIGNKHRIRAGQSLIIPLRGSKSFARERMAKRLDQGKGFFGQDGRAFFYIVREGDTLWEISRSMGIDLESLCRWNGIKNASRIYPGDRLKIRSGGRTAPSEIEGKVPPARNREG